MGGDGGTIGSTRRFLRGVGAANTTADATRHSAKELEEHKQDYALQSMRNCSLTGSPLNFQSKTGIVACAYGRLYNRESAVEALLRKKLSSAGNVDDGATSLGGHIRGLKDLYSVRFQIQQQQQSEKESSYVPICPVTGTVLNGTQPAFLIVTSSSKDNSKKKQIPAEEQEDRPNVISERAIKEIGIDALQSDFGPFDKEDMIRLAPPTYGPEWEKIQAKVQQQLLQQQEDKKKKKGNTIKRKQLEASTIPSSESSTKKRRAVSTDNYQTTKEHAVVDLRAVEVAKANANSAISSSSALSTLFVRK